MKLSNKGYITHPWSKRYASPGAVPTHSGIDEVQLVDRCHCGKPATQTENSPNMNSYCDDCTLVRCDAYPGACEG